MTDAQQREAARQLYYKWHDRGREDEDADALAGVMMKHTTTLGIRRQDLSRYALRREIGTVETCYGPVRVKKASGMGVRKEKAEYEDLAAIARKEGLSLHEVRRAVKETGNGSLSPE